MNPGIFVVSRFPLEEKGWKRLACQTGGCKMKKGKVQWKEGKNSRAGGDRRITQYSNTEYSNGQSYWRHDFRFECDVLWKNFRLEGRRISFARSIAHSSGTTSFFFPILLSSNRKGRGKRAGCDGVKTIRT